MPRLHPRPGYWCFLKPPQVIVTYSLGRWPPGLTPLPVTLLTLVPVLVLGREVVLCIYILTSQFNVFNVFLHFCFGWLCPSSDPSSGFRLYDKWGHFSGHTESNSQHQPLEGKEMKELLQRLSGVRATEQRLHYCELQLELELLLNGKEVSLRTILWFFLYNREMNKNNPFFT